MSMSRRSVLARGFFGLAAAPMAGKEVAASLGSRLAGLAGVRLPGWEPRTKHKQAFATGSAGLDADTLDPGVVQEFSESWWALNRFKARENVLRYVWAHRVDADLVSMRSLSPMTRQRIMRERAIERELSKSTLYSRINYLFGGYQ